MPCYICGGIHCTHQHLLDDCVLACWLEAGRSFGIWVGKRPFYHADGDLDSNMDLDLVSDLEWGGALATGGRAAIMVIGVEGSGHHLIEHMVKRHGLGTAHTAHVYRASASVFLEGVCRTSVSVFLEVESGDPVSQFVITFQSCIQFFLPEPQTVTITVASLATVAFATSSPPQDNQRIVSFTRCDSHRVDPPPYIQLKDHTLIYSLPCRHTRCHVVD
jgi:hypothetical protein